MKTKINIKFLSIFKEKMANLAIYNLVYIILVAYSNSSNRFKSLDVVYRSKGSWDLPRSEDHISATAPFVTRPTERRMHWNTEN